MQNFTLEKSIFKNKTLHFKFHAFCPPNVSQILNAVLSAFCVFRTKPSHAERETSVADRVTQEMSALKYFLS